MKSLSELWGLLVRFGNFITKPVPKRQDEQINRLKAQVLARKVMLNQDKARLAKREQEEELQKELNELNRKHKLVKGKLRHLELKQFTKWAILIGAGIVVLFIIIAIAGRC